MVVVIVCILMSLGILVSDISGNDVIKTTEAANSVFGFAMIFTYCACMLINRRQFISLVSGMNDMVNESRSNHFYIPNRSLTKCAYFVQKGFG